MSSVKKQCEFKIKNMRRDTRGFYFILEVKMPLGQWGKPALFNGNFTLDDDDSPEPGVPFADIMFYDDSTMDEVGTLSVPSLKGKWPEDLTVAEATEEVYAAIKRG